MRTKLIRYLSNPEFCSSIGGYGIEILEDNLPDFAIFVTPIEEKAILGLALCKRKRTSLSIEVLCGNPKIRGVGSILLESLNEVAKVIGKFQLELMATPVSKPFYEYVGFACGGPTGHSCIKPVMMGGRRRKTCRRRDGRSYVKE